MLRIVSQHLSHFFLSESHHLVKAVGKWVISAYVETAGEVVEGYGTDTGYEDTLDGGISACLNGIKECAQVACAVRLALVFIKAGGIREDMIGEVVILVDEEIYFQTSLIAFIIYIVQLCHASVLFIQFIFDTLWQKPCIIVTKWIKARVAMRIQRTAIIAQVGIDHRKVEINNEILVVIGCRMLADI